jgi:adenine-specific DNA-methyltransferase
MTAGKRKRQVATSPAASVDSGPVAANTNANRSLSLDVDPRKPRLAWQGMDRRELTTAVPTQIIEIVRPAKSSIDGHQRSSPSATRQEMQPNRLIWTNDNLVALQTLVDERDPLTKAYRYRGKIDLVYIDPPFMVQSDFVAENSIDIELDDTEHVEAKKESSLVEILAYRDTWRQGLDSFLSMLRARVVLLKSLLAPTGSIYVHLDWHAVHYVKVMMDEIFGYENFRNEIIWQRTSSHNDPGKYGVINDSLLFYSASESMYWGDPTRYPPATYFQAHDIQSDENGRLFRARDLTAPQLRFGETGEPWRGLQPASKGRHWAVPVSELEKLDREGLVLWSKRGEWPRLKVYLSDDRGIPVQSIWSDIAPVNSQAAERLGYPTQKPLALVERILAASCPPQGLVLDCFAGSGTVAEAAERLGRRWIGIDNSKYAIHLSRKRLIRLHGQLRATKKPTFDFMRCKTCKNVERKERPPQEHRPIEVRPFSIENMGVYQRAEKWQDFQTKRSRYRDEMIKLFGGEPINHSALLHGRKGNSWIHVGPLDGPVSVTQVWSIAREAQRTDRKMVTVLSADFDTLAGSKSKDEIKTATGVIVTVRMIPASAIEEVRRRLEVQNSNRDTPFESMAIPAFYAPLSISLGHRVAGRVAKLVLKRCEIDIESFIASQRPVLRSVSAATTTAAKKRLQGEIAKWQTRQRELEKWLAKANSWQKFIDFWAVDWKYGSRVGPDDNPIFEADWQSFRVRKSKSEVEPLVLAAEYKYENPGPHCVAARVTDVFGNDGIATVTMEVS